MRRAIILIAVLFCCPAWSLTFMGSPSSNVKQGEIFLGFDYSNSELDFEISGPTINGVFDDVDIDMYMGRVGIGVFDGMEVFGRFGVGEIEAFGNDSAWGAGARATIAEDGDVSWGVLFQLLSLHCDGTGNLGGSTLNGDFDAYEYQLAIGPTFDNKVYLGPFFHFIDGDADLAGHGNVDVEQEAEVGLFIGVFWELGETTTLSIEFQGTDDAKMGGISLVHRFGGSDN